MAICKEKPDSLPPLDAIGLEPNEHQNFPITRGGSHGRRTSSSAMPPARQASVGLGISGFNKPSVNPFTMGQFSTPTQKLATSEERFAAAALSATDARVAVGVGSAFDIISGEKPRAPQWMCDHGLEWLHRLRQEPRRLGRRYILEDSPFLFHLAGAVARKSVDRTRS